MEIFTKEKIDFYLPLKRFLKKSIDNGKNIVLWSLPKQDNIHLITNDTVDELNPDFEIEKLKSGFIISPFDQVKHEILFLEAQFYWNSNTPFPEDEQSQADKLYFYGPGKPLNTGQKFYQDLVKKGIEGIEEGQLEKIVPARAKTTPLPDTFDNLDFFLNLVNLYPDAFVSCYHIPDKGTWFGATPEILIEVKEEFFKTVSLAGTQPFENSHSIRETSWTQKEIEEQALVSRYIINCFKTIRLRDFEELGPKTVRAGNLLHLKTEFQVNLNTCGFNDLGTLMLKLLHPTSAVCGMPLSQAQEFIKKNEDIDRGYYSGYLGPVNITNSTNLFVNLRCLQIIKDNAVAYAGAGVTIDSDPAKEYHETEIKMNTLIRLLK